MSDVIEPWLRDILRCPIGKHELADGSAPDGTAELQCTQDCEGPGQRHGYPIQDGIPVLLADQARVFTV